ncbi:NADH dehydrogenase [ubiquinone] 1 alpha subcomplex subunit 9, mitochondrial-like [Mizuhopecten yessoensis]|uniref:NADH dehydrogenase [ubiquinone] 1 alpha subcomplex subunit 9, mitochondrial n=1 Tax=Mizuhopecten yessoensis TaxID=6573 RepID=A0A210QZL1_MIZYE|nr:NADH dehydrogenase [ubiquinone] 1 alpha subcomplex subunit 9, mitochondrial-like [Mizuhopecten yessoensis]OWF54190.1 NADH dehydrogenase [ubiquinone] 1 alpha subcomplex subunit 9, mitochondrial [Mizuhopecten yessoensis]
MAAMTVGQVALLGRLHIPRAVGGVYLVQHRDSSQLANIRRGRGGRSSFSGHVVTVFGATGFIGTKLINRLGKNGSKIVIPYRGEAYRAQHLKVASDLGQTQFMPFDLKDEDSIRRALQYSDTVINVIHKDYPTKRFSLEDVHITGARNIARLCREEGVTNLVHFSHLMASPDPEKLITPEGTEFLKAKYYGELAVREEFPEAIVFRPAIMFGDSDRFLRKFYYIGLGKRCEYKIKLWKQGKETIKMPVFGSDVVDGVISALGKPEARGQIYEALGPESYFLHDLVKFFYFCMRRPLVGFEEFTENYLMKMRYVDPRNPFSLYRLHNLYTLNQDFVNDQPTGLPTLEDLGVKLTKIPDRARHEYKTTRCDRYYDEDLGQFAESGDPPTASESELATVREMETKDHDTKLSR